MRDKDQQILDHVEEQLKELKKIKNITPEDHRRSFTDKEVRALLGAAKR